MPTRNTKALIYGIFVTDALTKIEDNEPLDILRAVCQNIRTTNSLQYVTLKNYLESKKEYVDFEPDDGSILVYISPLVFMDLFNEAVVDKHRVLKQIVWITHNREETFGVVKEYLNLLHDIFYNQITKEQILEILPELDILEDEVPVSTNVKDVFFTALWCLTMTDSYEQACRKAYDLKDSNELIIEITGALAGLYYGVESIPTEWIAEVETKFSIEEIIF
jgi:hypothetical protein